MLVYKDCQSCSMPLKKDPQHGGTNMDGSKNIMYCSYCYQNGKFTAADMTVEQMQILVKNKMKEMGFPSFLSSFFVRKIPKLKRWSKN